MLEILGKIGFDWQVALANTVNFIIIFFLLKKFAFGPIKKIIEQRQNKIDEGLLNAKKAETELMMAEELRNQKLASAKVEANTIIGDAQKKGDSMLDKSKEEATGLKASILAEGEKQISQKKESMRKDLEREQANLILNGVEKILKETLTEDQQKTYINKVLAN